MSANCKYYKEQRYVSSDGGQTWTPTSDYRRGELYESGSSDCGQIEIQYRWVNLDPSVDYYCSGTTKIYKQQYQQSTDGGQTWTNVVPERYQSGGTAQVLSTDCGYVPPTPTTQYRWKKLDPTYYYECSGTTKMYKEIYQQSTDGGTTWTNVVPETIRTSSDVAEGQSTDCGYIPPEPTCSCGTFDVLGLGVWASSAASSTEYTVARYTGATNCSEPFVFSLKSGADFMGDFRASDGYVYAKCTVSNPNESVRSASYYMTQGSCEGVININQWGKYVPPAETNLYWNRTGNPTAYAASTNSNYLDLSSFYSVLNDEYVNCVISANVDWITTYSNMYVNNNEMQSNKNNTIYFNSFNTGSSSRQGTLILTQKGGSRQITCTITQEVKPIDNTVASMEILSSEVCKGSDLNFTFTMEDSRCTDLPTFMVRDGENNWTTITASTINSGTGTGVINTSSMAAGSCTIHPVNSPSTYVGQNFTIADCGLAITMNVTTSVGQAGVQFIYLTSYAQSTNVQLSSMVTIPVGETVSIPMSLDADFNGKSITQIIMRNTSRTYGCSWSGSNVIVNGGTYNITIDRILN